MKKKSIVFFAFIFLFITSSCSNNANVPDEISGLFLQQKFTDEEAKKIVDELHLQTVSTETNIIAEYKGKEFSAVIYISTYTDEKSSLNSFNKMAEKISPRNSVFIGKEFINFEGKNVFRCFGMGQTHYSFVNGKDLYWISVDTMIAADFLKEYITNF